MRKINAFLATFLVVFILEILFSYFVFSSLSLKAICFYAVFSFLISSFIKCITSIFNSFTNKIINGLLVIFIDLLFVSQFVHFKFYNVFYSTYSLTHSAQIFAFLEAIINIMLENVFQIIILLLPGIIFILFLKKMDCFKNCLVSFIYLFLGVIGILLHITLVESDRTGAYSSYNLYFKNHSPSVAVRKLGLLNAMGIDLYRYHFGFDDEVLTSDSNDTYYNEQYNIFNFKFKSTNNKNIKAINKYISSKKPTNKNEYTGIFEGKNLIFITAESFSPIAIDKNITPTLYKLSNEGFNFSNYYTPIYYASTTDGEYTLLTSLLPTEGLWSLQESINNYFPYSYPYALGNSYKAYAYHNGAYDFYARNLSHTNLGYQFLGCGNGLEKRINCDIWPQSDLEMLNKTFSDYQNDERFVAYYMSISMHLSYNNKTHFIANKNKELVKNLPYNKRIKAYYATAIELDKAIEGLIVNLEKSNILDDTVIVLTADHFPYGLTKDDIKEVNKTLKDDKYDLHKNTLMIWNNKYKDKITTNKYASNVDVLPTLLNLFNVEYDSRLLMGNDILSDSEGLVIFNDKSWINGSGEYNAIKDEFTPRNEGISQEEIDKINKDVYNKFAVSRLILKEDYYRYLFK